MKPVIAGDQTIFLVALLETPGIGWKTFAAILRRNAVAGRTAEDFLALAPEVMTGDYGIPGPVAARLALDIRGRIDGAKETVRFLTRSGVSLITLHDATYPPCLTERLSDPPPALFVHGNQALFSAPKFAVANSNGAPEQALAATDSAAAIAVESGFVAVTGHNRPGYQRPALAARRSGGPVLYVLDRGLFHGFGGDLSRALFPAARIWGPSFDPACDLAVSPFPLRAQGIAANNRRRDAVIFALADCIFAGSARAGGQMERECLSALKRGQPVLIQRDFAGDSEALIAAGGLTADLHDPDSVRRFITRID